MSLNEIKQKLETKEETLEKMKNNKHNKKEN